MPEPFHPTRKILPCLLDRLTDGWDPETEDLPGASAGPAGHDPAGITAAEYRRYFLRDLRMLLNTKNRQYEKELEGFPHAERSVLNFGMRDPAGRTMGKQGIAELEKEMREAILRFEPRLLPGTLQIRSLDADTHPAETTSTVSFEISGTLWALPLPEHFQVRTEVNLENGRCAL